MSEEIEKIRVELEDWEKANEEYNDWGDFDTEKFSEILLQKVFTKAKEKAETLEDEVFFRLPQEVVMLSDLEQIIKEMVGE